MNMDLAPGRVVEWNGRLYLVETVELTVQMQQIDSLAPQVERMIATDWCEPYVHNPLFTRLHGKLGDPESPIEELKLLYKEEEL